MTVQHSETQPDPGQGGSVSVYLDSELMAFLDAKRRATRLSKSAMIRERLMAWYAQEKALEKSA